MKRIIHVVFLFLIILFSEAQAQDAQFTQFYAAPLYLNPAFAGTTYQSRVIFNNRYQWVSLPKPYVTYSASFDHNLEKYNSGIGVIAVVDRAGSGILNSTNLGFLYSYKIQLNN